MAFACSTIANKVDDVDETFELTTDDNADCAEEPDASEDKAGLIVTSGIGSCEICCELLPELLVIAVIDIESIGSTVNDVWSTVIPFDCFCKFVVDIVVDGDES